jgi:uncharacterized protein (UPF0248 family)
VIPVHELLSRIRWDSAFGAAEFAIGYYDRIADSIIVVPLTALNFSGDDHFDFTLVDDEGALRTIPLHRIRQVFRNGTLIWERRAG